MAKSTTAANAAKQQQKQERQSIPAKLGFLTATGVLGRGVLIEQVTKLSPAKVINTHNEIAALLKKANELDPEAIAAMPAILQFPGNTEEKQFNYKRTVLAALDSR